MRRCKCAFTGKSVCEYKRRRSVRCVGKCASTDKCVHIWRLLTGLIEPKLPIYDYKWFKNLMTHGWSESTCDSCLFKGGFRDPLPPCRSDFYEVSNLQSLFSEQQSTSKTDSDGFIRPARKHLKLHLCLSRSIQWHQCFTELGTINITLSAVYSGVLLRFQDPVF